MQYDIQGLKNNLLDYVESITKKSKGKQFVCPLCGSGMGRNHTGALTIRGTKWRCFSCGEGGDIFDLIAKYEGISDFGGQLRRAADYSNVPFYVTEKELDPAVDYTDFYIKANANLCKTDYRRGISETVLNRFKVGYVEKWKHPKAKKSPSTPRLIIPTSRESYLARDVRTGLSPKDAKFSKSKVGKVHIFNAEVLADNSVPVIVTEGEFDALSIIEAGGEAVALGGASNVNLLMMEMRVRTAPIIISVDNDETGKRIEDEIARGMSEMGIPFLVADIAVGCKDANEALVTNHAKFCMAVSDALSAGYSLMQGTIYPLKTPQGGIHNL